METLEVRGVSVSFDGRKVLEDVSVTLRKGELVCLLGVSGGGKTTLFNVISGLLKPDAGQVLRPAGWGGYHRQTRPYQLHAAKGFAAAVPDHRG